MNICSPKILITGGNGQIATAIKQHAKTKVINCSTHELDITSSSSIENTIKRYHPNVIINTAAYTAVDKAESEPSLAFKINAEGTKKLAILCKKNHIKLIHLSTDYVFDGACNIPYQEDDKTNPINIYGKSKQQGEEWVLTHDSDAIILRISAVFSRYGNNFLKTILRLLHGRESFSIVNDQLTCPTLASDIAIILAKLSETDITPGIYHYCSAEAVSWYDFAVEIAAAAGLNKKVDAISTAQYPTPAKRPLYSVLCCNKITQALNMRQPSWKMGLQQTVQACLRDNK